MGRYSIIYSIISSAVALHWPIVPKAHASPTNSKCTHVGSKVVEMCTRDTLRIRKPSYEDIAIVMHERKYSC